MSDKSKSKGKGIFRFILEVVVIFGIIAGIPFIVGGVWPPFVSIVSDSMEPNIETGDMIYVVDNERFTDDTAYGGVLTETEEERETFGNHGDVIVFYPDGDENEVPVIHRAVMYVEEDEDWTDRADSEYINTDSCDILSNCPAPHDGIITHGDANSQYDQTAELSEPVKEEWVLGRAQYRVPGLGWVRMTFESLTASFA